VALVAGTLDPGGAEKQMLYMVRALLEAGVEVRVFSLSAGEQLEVDLRGLGVEPTWVGRWANPVLRLAALARSLWPFRPHVVQATHFYTNLYARAAAMPYDALGIGALRSDVHFAFETTGRWAQWLLRAPRALMANSYMAKRNAEALGVAPESVCVVPNVIDLVEFDRLAANGTMPAREGRTVVANVGRHLEVKRLDRFLHAVALARRQVPGVTGLLIGDGTERPALERLAAELGLLEGGVLFAGHRTDVPRLLRRDADMLLLTSQHEGFPNAVLEAMAAGLPVISTPVGDVDRAVAEGESGFLVPFDDVEAMAERIVRFARYPEERRRFGAAARRRVVEDYGFQRLGERLLQSYRMLAALRGNARVLAALPE